MSPGCMQPRYEEGGELFSCAIATMLFDREHMCKSIEHC